MAAPKDEESAHAFVRARQRGCLTNSQPEARFLRGERSSSQRCPQIVVRRKMLFHKKKGTHGTPFFTCTIYEKQH
jgi:hypothetical protein